MAEPKSVFIERDGVRLHGLDHGSEGEDKPVILMLHGAAAHARWWDHIAPHYRDMLRPVATDHRGHGDSEWLSEYVFEDLLRDVDGWVEWAKAASGRKPWLMAHSMGGVIALNLFALEPPDVEGLIIVDSPLRTTDAILAEVRAFGNRPARPWASQELFMEKFRLLPASDKVKPETIAHIARHAVRQNGDGTWTVKADRRFHAARPETDQRAGWLRVETPALLVAGELSDRLKSDSLDWVREKIPHVETAVIPGAHHHVFMDEPDEFIRVTREFLERTMARASERSASQTV